MFENILALCKNFSYDLMYCIFDNMRLFYECLVLQEGSRENNAKFLVTKKREKQRGGSGKKRVKQRNEKKNRVKQRVRGERERKRKT